MNFNSPKRYEDNTILVVGMLRTGDANPITAMYENLVLVLIVEKESGLIVNAQFNAVCKITDEFVASILVGRNLYTETEFLCDQIKERYLGASKKTLISCLKDARNKITMCLNN